MLGGLRMATNNQAEAYALYQDLNIATSLGIRELVVIGDSRIVLKSLTHQELLNDFQLGSIFSITTKITQQLAKIYPFMSYGTTMAMQRVWPMKPLVCLKEF